MPTRHASSYEDSYSADAKEHDKKQNMSVRIESHTDAFLCVLRENMLMVQSKNKNKANLLNTHRHFLWESHGYWKGSNIM